MYLRSVSKLRVVSFGAATLLAMTLAGCSAKDLALDDSFSPYTPSERYPIQYAKGPVTLNVDARKGSLKQAQVDTIIGFARQSKARGQSPVTVSRPTGGGGKASAVAEQVAMILLKQGVPRNQIHLASYPAGSDAPVQLAYVKAYAHTKACGEWDENLADTGSNERFNNHGCAVQSNIAAMIANPEDLVKPSVIIPAPAAASTAAIRKISDGQGTQSSGFSIF